MGWGLIMKGFGGLYRVTLIHKFYLGAITLWHEAGDQGIDVIVEGEGKSTNQTHLRTERRENSNKGETGRRSEQRQKRDLEKKNKKKKLKVNLKDKMNLQTDGCGPRTLYKKN